MLTFLYPNHAQFLLLRFGIVSLLLFGSACSSVPTYESAFSPQHEIKGNSDSIAAPMDVTWGSVLEIMAQRGWIIQQADTKSHLILAHREIRDKEDKDLSYAITVTVTLISTNEQTTQVIAAANQTTEIHRKEYQWWHLLWLIPIFPIGTEYSTVVVSRDTVHAPQLYQDFFSAVKQRCDEKKI
jgi:hypothetical protein